MSEKYKKLSMVEHAFNTSYSRSRSRCIFELEASLVYTVNFRRVRATQRNLVWKTSKIS